MRASNLVGPMGEGSSRSALAQGAALGAETGEAGVEPPTGVGVPDLQLDQGPRNVANPLNIACGNWKLVEKTIKKTKTWTVDQPWQGYWPPPGYKNANPANKLRQRNAYAWDYVTNGDSKAFIDAQTEAAMANVRGDPKVNCLDCPLPIPMLVKCTRRLGHNKTSVDVIGPTNVVSVAGGTKLTCSCRFEFTIKIWVECSSANCPPDPNLPPWARAPSPLL